MKVTAFVGDIYIYEHWQGECEWNEVLANESWRRFRKWKIPLESKDRIAKFSINEITRFNFVHFSSDVFHRYG